MERPKRPLLVTILAVYFMLGALLAPVWLLAPFPQDAIDSIAAFPFPVGWMARQFGAAGLMIINFVVFLSVGTVGFGLWRLKNWARIVTMSLAAFGTLSACADLIHRALRFRFVDWPLLFTTAVFAFPLYYFQRRYVRDRFAPAAQDAAH
jgi:hypothetical protein